MAYLAVHVTDIIVTMSSVLYYSRKSDTPYDLLQNYYYCYHYFC